MKISSDTESIFSVNGTLKITVNGIFYSNGDKCYGVHAHDGSNGDAIIESGEFHSDDDETLYIGNGASITVNGGTYKCHDDKKSGKDCVEKESNGHLYWNK